MEPIREPIEFEWDAGNRDKNLKHRVTDTECEETFFDPHKRLLKEIPHVGEKGWERRYVMIGKTREGRALFVVFTLRKGKVRVISARDLNRRERGLLP